MNIAVSKITKHFPVLMLALAGLSFSSTALAVDSYRYAHVTIETPWMIFLFLLVVILLPFIVMAILYWRYTFQKEKPGSQDAE